MSEEIVALVDQLERLLPEDRYQFEFKLPGGRVVKVERAIRGDRP